MRADLYDPIPDAPIAAAPSVPQQIVKETAIFQREPLQDVSVRNEIDVFYARLAKIQVEKHQLAEALALIQKIKSETFRVRTVVDLAEFVSRDKNYQSEAEQLYRLALAGMAALDKKEPFRIDADSKKETTRQPRSPEPVFEPVFPDPLSDIPIPAPVVPPPDIFVPVIPEQVVPRESEPIKRDPVQLPDDDPPDDTNTTVRNGNGRQPPPPPPTEDVNDVVVYPPPGNQQSEEAAPPARTQQGNVSPLPPGKEPPPASSTETKESLPDAIIKPPPGILLEDEEPGLIIPQTTEKSSTETKIEVPTPAQQPREPRRRPVSIVIPDEN
jgi:hypothetical protein